MQEECTDGRHLGFDGKVSRSCTSEQHPSYSFIQQAIHPSQVSFINRTFVPTESEILRAAKILHQMSLAHAGGSGAFGLELAGDAKGRKEMIDAPMVKQVCFMISEMTATKIM